MKRILIISVFSLTLFGCHEHRDLHITSAPMIHIEGDWMPSLGVGSMLNDATAMAFTSSDGVHTKEYFLDPNNIVTFPLRKGLYSIMIFNGMMYSEQESGLYGVFFRGTDNMKTFEVVAEEVQANRRLGRSDGEYIAGNQMEIVTSAVETQIIESDYAYHIKYKNGINVGNGISGNYIEAELSMTPVAMSYECTLTVTVYTISSIFGADAQLRGFVGSAFVASRQPSHFFVTHQSNLNNRQDYVGTDTGTIEATFITFGPPTDLPAHRYEVYIRAILVNGQVVDGTYDVTDQILPVLADIQSNLSGMKSVRHGITIPIDLSIELPTVEPVEGVINLEEWGEDEIIKVVIPKPKS